MQRILIFMLLTLFAGPQNLFADRTHHRIGVRFHADPQSHPRHNGFKRSARHSFPDMHRRIKLPSRLPVHPGSPGKPFLPIHPGYEPGRPGHGRPGYWWPAATTTVRETQPIIVVVNPPPVAPAPFSEPKEVWVPPVMDTRTEPGYWDYGVKKTWMGDHWRYEQDHEKRIWVPAFQVRYVKQEGYWKPVD